MSQNVEPPDGPPFHDLALELFGEGEWSRGGRLGDVFADFMRRHGNRLRTDHLLYGSRNFVFDERLPEPGVVPAQIYESEKDRGEMFLTELQEGVETGLVFDAETILDGGHPALLGLSDAMVMAQKDIDAGRRHGWLPGERLEVRHQAWLRGGYIFMLETDTRGFVIHFPDDARPIAFKTAREFLESVGRFKGLLGLVAITMGKRVPRDGTAEHSLLSSGIWDDGLMRLDLGRDLLFVPTHRDDRPWEPRFENMYILNRALHPECEPVHEITEPGHLPERPVRDGEDVEAWSEKQPGRGESVAPSAKAVKDCCRWLEAQRAAGPQRAKDGYWEIASEEFKRLSRRGFDRAWANAVGDDPRWTRAGPKPKAPKA